MRNLAHEPRPVPVTPGMGAALCATASATAWRDLYRRAPRDGALARDLLAQLDLDPVAHSAHLALYVLSQEAMRRSARQHERVTRVLRSRLVRAVRIVWRRWRSSAAATATAHAQSAQPRSLAHPVGAEGLAMPPASATDDLTVEQMEAELLATATSLDPAAHRVASRSAELERRLEIARTLLLRKLERQLRDGPCISSPQALRDWLCLRYAGLDHEVLMVLFLDAQHRLIEAEQMFRGSLTDTPVYPRKIVKAALRKNAAAIVMVHNHPSAALEPSAADQLLTKRVGAALELVDVKLIDHFVVAGARMVSMAQRGLL